MHVGIESEEMPRNVAGGCYGIKVEENHKSDHWQDTKLSGLDIADVRMFSCMSLTFTVRTPSRANLHCNTQCTKAAPSTTSQTAFSFVLMGLIEEKVKGPIFYQIISAWL